MNYNPLKIEKKWQKIWETKRIYRLKDKIKGKKNFYHLVMFPYSSGDLHIGHWYNFGPADVFARLKMMQGFNVLSPIGFDAFGLPAENAAIKKGISPWIWTNQNIKKMRQQLKSIGAIYDWSREIITSAPEYYKWTQWMFLQLYKNGLAYRKKAAANWCPSCQTILANEQVINGKCERCESQVLQKEIEQWLFKTTKYAERLLKDLNRLDWPEKTKIMQRNWIGKSEGAEINFPIVIASSEGAWQSQEIASSSRFGGVPRNDIVLKVFTTRPDTLFGCTYLVLSSEHKIISNFKSQISNWTEVEEYIEEIKKKNELERMISMEKEKTGVELKGIKAINPVNNQEIPIWISDYVLMGYGTGAIMAVPAHDQRDFEFAQKFELPIKMVICPNYPKPICPVLDKAYEENGHLVDSGQFTGLSSVEAKDKIVEWLKEKNLATQKIYYKLRDWLISRQRYWGAPIPIIYCQKCGELPVPEKDLPVLLPKNIVFKPSGESPLARFPEFVKIKCPKCKGPAKRETDTMDTFVCSSWYFLRYADPRNKKKFADSKKIKAWLPINMYVGGAEHSVLHLLYARFFIKVLKDLGYLDFSEPFLTLRHQGIILGEDGQKMSKSRGNVVDPDGLILKCGADAMRMYLCFMGPYEQGGPWQSKGIEGINRFLKKIWRLFGQNPKSKILNPKKITNSKSKTQNLDLERLLHKTIKKVTEDIEQFKFNTAISALMILVSELEKNQESASWRIRSYEILLKLLAPFAPHFAEELWSQLHGSTGSQQDKKSIFLEKWPKYNSKLIREKVDFIIIQINGKLRDQIEAPVGASEAEIKKIVLENDKVQKWLIDREIKKIIFIPGKLMNLVV